MQPPNVEESRPCQWANSLGEVEGELVCLFICPCRENLGQWEKIVRGEEASSWVPVWESAESSPECESANVGPVKVDNWPDFSGCCPPLQAAWKPGPVQRLCSSSVKGRLPAMTGSDAEHQQVTFARGQQSVTLPRWWDGDAPTVSPGLVVDTVDFRVWNRACYPITQKLLEDHVVKWTVWLSLVSLFFPDQFQLFFFFFCCCPIFWGLNSEPFARQEFDIVSLVSKWYIIFFFQLMVALLHAKVMRCMDFLKWEDAWYDPWVIALGGVLLIVLCYYGKRSFKSTWMKQPILTQMAKKNFTLPLTKMGPDNPVPFGVTRKSHYSWPNHPALKDLSVQVGFWSSERQKPWATSSFLRRISSRKRVLGGVLAWRVK